MLYLCIFLVLMAASFAAFTIWATWRFVRLYRFGRRATAVVVGIKGRWELLDTWPGPKRIKFEWPVIRYTDAEGCLQEHELQSATETSPSQLCVGQSVPIIYLPGSAEEAVVDSFWSTWGTVLVLALITSGFTATAVLFGFGATGEN